VTTGDHDPTTGQRLAIESLLKKGALAIAILEDLAWALDPAVFEVAFMNRQPNILRAIVPFPCFPVGALIRTPSPDLEVLRTLLDGLDALVTQERECLSTGFDDCGL
ncbi:PRAME family member 18, partial [Lemmus lemmus]